ncbi:Transcription initiation factor TFIID subunit 8 [Linum grandiflorum]
MKTRSALRRQKTPTAAAATPPQLPAINPSSFAADIARIAIAQICKSVGYKSAESPALETLNRVAMLYMETLATAAASYANRSNRTQSNVFDVVNALNDLNSARGFTGAAGIHEGCVLKSGVVKEVERFVNTVDEIPFAKPIPKANNRCPDPGTGRAGVEVRGKHIPDWLPDFPDKSTYVEEVNGRERERELELWEKLRTDGPDGGEWNGGGGKVKGEKSGGELGKKREKVKFQFGNKKTLALKKKRRTE